MSGCLHPDSVRLVGWWVLLPTPALQLKGQSLDEVACCSAPVASPGGSSMYGHSGPDC